MTTFWTQDATLPAVVLATFLPLVSFVLIMLITRSSERLSAALSISTVAVSLACSLFLLASHWHLEQPIQYLGRWVVSSSIDIPFGFLLDPLSLLMLVIVAAICLLVQLYSLGYMAGDKGFSRYYAFMSLFAWAMLSLTVSPTLLQLYIFWELVGLSSYLLIGFWYEKFSATQAGKKAFVMTRAGDVAFFVGMITVLLHMGSLSIPEMNDSRAASFMSPTLLTLSSLLIFGGIVGKSAQFPLMTWLPDAMEGPTPVSALLHSATMVAAGVYLLARLFPFFSLSPTAMDIFLAIGTISMLMASTMAVVSRDIKKVWAYSTISQLGYMIMGLAAGGYFAGVFHLTTHAGFKALLFLCAGVFIHQAETNDIFELARLGVRRMKIPAICMAVGAAALAGLPPFSGFFSKEAILGQLSGLSNPLWLLAALLGFFLTAYYAFRVIFVVCFPQGDAADGTGSDVSASPPDSADDSAPGPVPGSAHGPALSAGTHAAEYRKMAWPLVVLAGITVVLGFFEDGLRGFLANDLGALYPHHGGDVAWVPYVAITLTLGGVGLAWAEFGRRGAAQVGFAERIEPIHKLFLDRWYLDAFYLRFVELVIDRGLSRLFARNDNEVIDGSIDAMCKSTVETGRIVSLLHLGMVQYRLLGAFAVMVLLSLCLFF
jgi:NADH-quinone oxidoreductase subunit L